MVLVQSDALMVVDCINGIQDFAAIKSIAADCRKFLKCFSLAYIMFISRNCNVDAHNLVSLDKQLGSRTCLGAFLIGIPWHLFRLRFIKEISFT